jgi:hypothetical protein
MTLVEIVEGWTDEIGPFTLKADDVAVDLTGLTVELIIRSKNGALVETTSDARVDDDPTTGQVYWTPDAADLSYADSPYAIRWKVTDGDGNVVFFPSGAADHIKVYRA